MLEDRNKDELHDETRYGCGVCLQLYPVLLAEICCDHRLYCVHIKLKIIVDNEGNNDLTWVNQP